jgi:hypothetical protein
MNVMTTVTNCYLAANLKGGRGPDPGWLVVVILGLVSLGMVIVFLVDNFNG